MAATSLAPQDHELRFEAELRGHRFRFLSTWGLFHPRGIDAGTALLLDRIEVAADAACLDLGCGWGAVGCALSKLAPKGQVDLVDKDFVAVGYARRNTVANGCSNARVYLSNGFHHVEEDARFDLIASNLPAQVGSELLGHWMAEASRRLRPGGVLWVVTVAGLKAYVKRQFGERFGNYRKVAQGRSHVVAAARRE